MPTMTQHALTQRRLHRHSTNEEQRRGAGAESNKENFGVHFMSSPFGNSSISLIALQDLSNVHGKSPTQRRSFSEGSGPRQATPQRGGGAGAGAGGGGVPTPLAALRRLEDSTSQLSSSRMGDTTLDRMLDAIIESARKERKDGREGRCKYAMATKSGDWSEESSVHEMEVRTPTHLKRQRVVRRKNQQKTTREKSMGKESKERSKLSMEPQQLPSTKRCLSFSSSTTSTSSDLDNEFEHEEHFGGLAKRGSMASASGSVSALSVDSDSSSGGGGGGRRGSLQLATFYNQREQQLNVHVIRCRDLQRSQGSVSGSVTGSVLLSGPINAYVKVSLAGNPGYQRTAVHRQSNRPHFDQRFSFHVPPNVEEDAAQLQLAVWHRDRHLKRSEFLGCRTFSLAALLKQSHSGCYKLESQACLHNVHNNAEQQEPHQQQQQQQQQKQERTTEKQSQRRRRAQAETSEMATAAQQQQQKLCAVNDDVISIDTMTAADDQQQPMLQLSKKALHQRDADENLFLRFLELDPPIDDNANATSTTTTTAITTTSTTMSSNSNTATVGNAAANNANHVNGSARRFSMMPGGGGGGGGVGGSGGGSGGSGGGGGGGRQQVQGRTPFTMTKRLTRTEERGFGFSIVWTHPPRVEKIESQMSAERCGILPGDYVIFVDKHNVVTMPEADVLNLIRSQGASLTLEIFRRSGTSTTATTATLATPTTTTMSNPLQQKLRCGSMALAGIACIGEEQLTSTTTTATTTTTSLLTTPPLTTTTMTAVRGPPTTTSRPPTACSGTTTTSIEAAKRRLHLPQVTFSKESIVPITDNRRRFLLQLISREQNFTAALHFGIERFVQPLLERKDLISPNDHRTLFQNIDELLRIAEDILEQLCSSNEQDQEPHMNFASRVYLSKTTAICAAYKKYCNGIKRADCVLVNKSRQTGSEFIAFITEPAVPRKRPDLTMFIHRPLQHFREILKLMQLLASNCHVDTEEQKNFNNVIGELQAAYREITVSSGLMEPLGEGRPLLTLQDLESRMVFTKCKPFTLAVQGRQWIFGGDLSRVEGRSIKPYWTLLFSDIIVFAKVSRDRVLFITEEPIPIANVVDSCFHMRKKTSEFRLTVDPNGRLAESPTGYCAPDLTRTPKRGARRKNLILRAPSLELKAVWQNLLQRQIFLVNAALGSTPLSSPLDSPDVLNTLVPLSDIGITSASMCSMKLPSSLDSININLKQQQQQQKQQQRCQGQTAGHVEQSIELLIDEKCRILNKTGTPKSSALHLANWMKGQLDKQQQQARLAAIARSRETISVEDEQLIFASNSDSEQDSERITYWTRQQLERRTKELNLTKENGGLLAKPNFGGKRLSGVEELSMSASAASEVFSEAEVEAGISQSHSTTSDSQITVRSSPIVLDKLAVCRHCHKNCQQTKAHSDGVASSVLLCNSLKVQHSQSSPHRCCSKINGIANSRPGSVTSISSSTITGEQFSELSSKVVASSGRREDTESDVAQLITDELSQSEATDDSVGAMPNSSSSAEGPKLRLRILEQPKVTSPPLPQSQPQPLANGHCVPTAMEKPLPPPRKTRSKEPPPRSPPSPQKIKMKSTASPSSSPLAKARFTACHCRCTPEDFTNFAHMAADKMEQQTCKLIDSPSKQLAARRCVCQLSGGNKNEQTMATVQAPTIMLNNEKAELAAESEEATEANFVPIIAVLPPTPDAAVLTKTSTHVWDNSGSSGGSDQITTMTTTTSPRQPIIENIPEDSCDESPLDEEPPYRPMTNTLRRFGTMSSLEKLPNSSEERMDEADELDEDDDDLQDFEQNGDDHDADNDDDVEDEEQEEIADRALTQDVASSSTAMEHTHFTANGDVLAIGSGAWTNRAGAFVSDKMSFFEESRAFIDKYLGRWSAESQPEAEPARQQATSETDEQIDECTSGATSGEEVWGTPTSGGENDDMQLINSENLSHSSPTKSSTSLNDDDDTELMMDELLMAPPMTASTIRGLLPRRRLEPLFEEETESDEEKTQLDDTDDIKKGETTTNGHYLEHLAGNSSDEAAQEGEETKSKQEEEEEEPNSSEEERLQPNLATIGAQGPRPLAKSMITTTLLPTTAIKNIETTTRSPIAVTEREYLLEQRHATAATMTTPTAATPSTAMPTMQQRSAPMTTDTATLMATATANRAPSSITTTISSESGTTSNNTNSSSSAGRASNNARSPIFVPPPPPPRRLLLTQTNLSSSAVKMQPQRIKSGATADNGCLAAAGDVANASPQIAIASRTTCTPTPTIRSSPSSTIIETCLLGTAAAAAKPISVTSSATVSISRTAKPLPPPSPAMRTSGLASSPAVVAAAEPNATIVNTRGGSADRSALRAGCGLSPRLEMRLALNHDILGDEDLICYEPGPDLTTILGHDLSTFHRLTGRDLLSRSATNRVQPKEAVISYSQHRNSKMDTPTVNRRPRPAPPLSQQRSHSISSSDAGSARTVGGGRDQQCQLPKLKPNPNIWNSFASAAPVGDVSESVAGSSIKCNYSSDANKLGDLEILARREKIYCMSQSKSGYQARATTSTTTMSTTMVATSWTREEDSLLSSRAAAAAATLTRTMSITSMDAATTTTTDQLNVEMEALGKSSNRLINFIKRRNSEITTLAGSSSKLIHTESVAPSLLEQPRTSQSQVQSQGQRQTADLAQMSPRKDNDKPSLNRRLWKQIIKRRRANSSSVSQIVAG